MPRELPLSKCISLPVKSSGNLLLDAWGDTLAEFVEDVDIDAVVQHINDHHDILMKEQKDAE